MLSVEQTINYIRQAKNGSQSAKEELLKNNTSLLKSIVKRFLNKGVEYDDLYQLACLGFIKAIQNFDEKFEVRFSTYAVPMIAGEIKRFMRDDGAVKVSRIIKNLSYKINAYLSECERLGKSSPTVKELAKEFEVEQEDVVLALGVNRPLISLNATDSDGDDKKTSLIDRLESNFTEDDLVERIMVKKAIDALDEREKKIIILRYYKDLTQSQIAKELGVSQVQVSRIEQSTLKKLKSKM